MSNDWRPKGFGERYAEGAALGAIDCHIRESMEARRKIERKINWLLAVRERRVSELARGEWPPKKEEVP